MGIELSTGNIRQLVILKKEAAKSQIDSGQANLILKVYAGERFKKAMVSSELTGCTAWLGVEHSSDTIYIIQCKIYRTLYRFKITRRKEE